MAIRVQAEDFDVGAELAALTEGNRSIGGVTSFVGLVREMGNGPSAMTLEHYPGMTERQLAEIEAEANVRWPLQASLIIHRYGRLEPGDRIVLVATASQTPGSGLRELPFPDRLAEDQSAVLEAGGDRRRQSLGRGQGQRRCRRGEMETTLITAFSRH